MNLATQTIWLARRVSSFVVGMEGNVSCKYGKGFLIKRSGSTLKSLSKQDLVYCDDEGIPQGGTYKPSMEVDFHSHLYKTTPYKFISHTHPVNTLKILCRKDLIADFASRRLFPDQVIFNGKKSCVVDYATPGAELKDAIKEAVSNFYDREGVFPKLILLQNHGIVALGMSVDECTYITEVCEKSAELFFSISSKPEEALFLSREEIDKLIKDKNEIYRASLLNK